jgi:3-hydroxyisobutyrate dehydrogenase-like beta-hydroxyacid dehydrogenase
MYWKSFYKGNWKVENYEQRGEETLKVALIGLGSMGVPIAENLLNHGYELVVYNRTESKSQDLATKGAIIANTPAEAATQSEIVFTILSDDTAVENVVYGEEGILAGLSPAGIHVSMSTISVHLAKKLASDHENKNQHFVSSTVLGRPDAAAVAALRFMVAGPEQAREKVVPILRILGQDVFTIGAEGYLSNVVKLGTNFLLVAMLESLSESLVMVEKHGVEPKQFLEVINSLFSSPIYKNYGNIILNEQFDPAGFKLKLGLKDVNLMIDAANEVSTELPIATLAQSHYTKGIEKGWGDLDWAALIKVIKDIN